MTHPTAMQNSLIKMFIDMGKGLEYKVKRGKKFYVPDDLNCIKTIRKKDWKKYSTTLRGVIHS